MMCRHHVGEGCVFWWFERSGRYLRYEVRDLPDGRYEFLIVDTDGSERTEHFNGSSDLTKRQVDFERDLAADGWTGPHGWNL
jgi:hypothetical protein